jgi:flagellar motor switch protein FliG
MNTPTRRSKASNVTPAQRAAVIIALLGESAAKPIVEKLDDAALSKVVSALEDISILGREELVEIVVDFLAQLRQSSGALRGGRDRAREVMAGILDPSRMGVLFTSAPIEFDFSLPEIDVWTRLRARDPKQIAEYLGRLPPNIIAIVMKKLDPGVVSIVLCMLPESKVSPTLGNMVASSAIDPGIEQAVEKMIEIEFLNRKEEVAESSDEYLETVGEVLSLIPDDKRDNLVAFLKAKHETKLPIIQKGLFTIESLPEILPRNSVPVVFREIENDVLIRLLASLRENYTAVIDYLLANISSRMAEQFRDEIKDLPSIGREAAETIQRDFLTSIMDMKRRGVITIVRAPKPE